jgi:hypothetical protein
MRTLGRGGERHRQPFRNDNPANQSVVQRGKMDGRELRAVLVRVRVIFVVDMGDDRIQCAAGESAAGVGVKKELGMTRDATPARDVGGLGCVPLEEVGVDHDVLFHQEHLVRKLRAVLDRVQNIPRAGHCRDVRLRSKQKSLGKILIAYDLHLTEDFFTYAVCVDMYVICGACA